LASFLSFSVYPLGCKVLVLQPIFNQTIFCTKNLNFYYQASLSLAYFSRRYHWFTNPTNTAVGSHISSTGYMGFGLGYQFPEKIRLEMTVGLSHFSNANSSSPNVGVNIPSLSLAMGYKIKGEQPGIKAKPLAELDPKIYSAVRVGYGFSEASTPSGPKYPIYTFAYFLNRNVSPIFRLRAGGLFLYSQKAQEIKKDLELPNEGLQENAFGATIFAGGELLIGHTGVVVEGGWNALRPFQMPKKVYTKMGLQFYPFDTQIHSRKQLYMGLYVHAHSGEADFAEIGVGYVF
jgi:Lipid A 3-O-deacylase (PagL)